LDGSSYGATILPQEDESINATFASLYFDFRQSISKLAFLTARETSALTPSASTGPSDPDTQTEIVMTKAQYQLTLDEKLFWEQLVSSPSIIMDSSEEEFSSAVETLVNLTHTSNMMSESYERRTNPPTAQTYEESRGIIQAMGVPCVDSVGPFEAEALASSIVLSGLADYVASEDTVRMLILLGCDVSCDKRFAGCFGL
jgi:flap endonuclease-1